MKVVDRYIGKVTAGAFLASLVALTAVVWITQALRNLDLLTSKGQSIFIFFYASGLIIPSLLTIIAPIALFIGVVYTLNKLNGDSELVVMNAGGLTPAQLLRPFAFVAVLAALMVAILSLYLMPWSFLKTRNLLSAVRADFVTHVARPGAFNTLAGGFVFHYRERSANDGLLGIFIQDRRNPAQINTYIAEEGATLHSKGQNYLLLRKGSLQRQNAGSIDPDIVQFDQYAIDLSQFGAGDVSGIPLKPREMDTASLMALNFVDAQHGKYDGRFVAELHDRFLNPIFAIVFMMIGFAALRRPRTTRQSQAIAIAGASAIALLVRILAFAASAITQKSGWGVAFSYALAFGTLACAVAYTFAPSLEYRIVKMRIARGARPA